MTVCAVVRRVARDIVLFLLISWVFGEYGWAERLVVTRDRVVDDHEKRKFQGGLDIKVGNRCKTTITDLLGRHLIRCGPCNNAGQRVIGAKPEVNSTDTKNWLWRYSLVD